MIVDITEKLNFEENPKLVICGEELEINGDAETMLRLMSVFSRDDDVGAVDDALKLLFNKKDLDKIGKIKKEGKKLSASAIRVIVNEAINILMESDDQSGNADPTTT